MSEAREIPTPWHVVREVDLDGTPELWIVGPGGESIARIRVTNETDEANVNRIILAVNQHEMLVVALREILALTEDRKPIAAAALLAETLQRIGQRKLQ